MWTRAALGGLLAAALGCSGNSRVDRQHRGNGAGGSDTGGSSTGGTSTPGGAGSGSGGSGGSAGTPPLDCEGETYACDPGSRCVPKVFEDARFFGAGNSPASFELGDVNGDGHLDVVVVGLNGGLVALLGTGDGGFSASIYNETLPGVGIALGLFDDDETLDAVIPSTTATVALAGDGTGRFGDAIPTEITGESIEAGDLDGDGVPDLALQSFIGNSSTILLGNGDRTFRIGEPIEVGYSPRDVIFEDMDGDRRLDIVAANVNGNDVTVLLGDGSGGFGLPSSFATGSNPWMLAAGDLNGDGMPDIITANDFSSTASVLFASGGGNLDAARTYRTRYGTGSVAMLDADGDGNLDFAVGNMGEVSGFVVSLFPGDGRGEFGEPRDFPIGYFVAEIVAPTYSVLAAADFNEDGRVDLAALNAGTAELAVLLATTRGTCMPE